jgi:glycosyltransferase involved in cell wall biosynthesis
MKILIITDAWKPQINGVVTTFINTIGVLKKRGHKVNVIYPAMFKTRSLPSYKEIKIAVNPWKVGQFIERVKPDAIHIATEGPIGLFAGMYCRWKGYNFTTSYHTKMPEYVNTRFPFISPKLIYKYMRFIHKGSKSILVTTPSMLNDLHDNKFDMDRLTVWGRGVNTQLFNSTKKPDIFMSKPYALYVGRISPEKNIEAFLEMKITYNGTNIPYRKVVVGSGPAFQELNKKYNDVVFVGAKKGEELHQWYANASVFVFPSKTDTYGIVMLEAMACGTPVIGYPVTGPIDCVEQGVTGILDDDLESAFYLALKLDRNKIAEVGKTRTWERCTDIFEKSLVNK